MEKDSDTMLPYLGLERFPDHPESQVSSGGEALVLSPSESPATKASTLQSKEISREKFYRAVPLMESRRSQLPEKPLEPDDMQYEKMYIEKGLSKKRHSRMPGLYRKSTPMGSPRRSIGIEALGGTIDEHLRIHSCSASQAAGPSPRFATTAPLRIMHRGSPVPNVPMIQGPGQGRTYDAYRDSVFGLLDQFPSPLSPSSPVTPAIGCVSLSPSSPSSPSNVSTVSMDLGSLNSDTSSKFDTYQRRSEIAMFSPLFQESGALQGQGSHVSHEHELVEFSVPDGLASELRVLARSPSNPSSSSQEGVSDIRPRSHWTAEEEALLDEYRCRSVQESNSDSSRVTRDSSIIFYNPFAADEGDDDEDEDLPIEALRERLELTSTLLPQGLEIILPVPNPTMAPRAQAASTKDPEIAGISCGPRTRSYSALMPPHIDVGGSPRFSVRALSTTPPIVSRTFLGGYCPSVAPPSLAKANHDDTTLKRWTEVPFKGCFPANFELALGGTSRYPVFPNSLHSKSRFTLSQQAVVANQPLGRHLAQSSPSVSSSLECNIPCPKPDNPTSYSQKRSFPEQTLMINSKRLRNNPNLEEVSSVKVRGFTNANVPSCLPGVFGCNEAENTAENDVQTTDDGHSGSKRARRVLGASNWRPPTCWEMPGWEPAVELIGERNDQGHIITASPPPHPFASDSKAMSMHTPSTSLFSPSLSASKASPEFRRSRQQRSRTASRLPHLKPSTAVFQG